MADHGTVVLLDSQIVGTVAEHSPASVNHGVLTLINADDSGPDAPVTGQTWPRGAGEG